MKGTIEAYLTIPVPKRNGSRVFGPVIMALTEAEKMALKMWNCKLCLLMRIILLVAVFIRILVLYDSPTEFF